MDKEVMPCCCCGQHPADCLCAPIGMEHAMTAPTSHAALVDAVAEALYEDAVDCDGHAGRAMTWPQYLSYHGDAYTGVQRFRRRARAAIAVVREALREPDARMVEAGEKQDRPAATYSGYSTEYADCERHWRAMLAASPLAEDGDA